MLNYQLPLVKKFIGFSCMLILLLIAGTVAAQTNLPPVSDQAASNLPLAQTGGSQLGSLPAIPGLPALTVKTNPNGTQEYTVTLQILAIMTALTFLPAILMSSPSLQFALTQRIAYSSSASS